MTVAVLLDQTASKENPAEAPVLEYPAA